MSQDATFLRLPAVEARTGLKRPTIYALASAGKFPRPVKIGPRASAWILAEIQDWEAARIRESREPAAA
jgi:prophage regulatory protein